MVSLWFLIVGILLLGIALLGSFVRRLPFSTAIVYLAVGYGLGPLGIGLINIHPLHQATFIERMTEIAVIVSLFTAGLKLRLPINDKRWRRPLRLAFGSMTLTVLGIAAAGVYGMGLSWGVGILLGAILAPTDPVLASDVQVEHPYDYDPLRFSLTGEAGLNDGTAFPFVMLGLGLVGAHDIGAFGLRWIGVDVLWAIGGALAIGTLLGTTVSQFVLYLRREHREAMGLDEFLTMGLIGVSYGLALMCHTYGFLAVFAAGLALRRVEREHASDKENEQPSDSITSEETTEEAATHPEKAPAAMAKALLNFNEQLEHLGELFVVVMIGAMLSWPLIPIQTFWFLPLLFLVIRPVSVAIGLWGADVVPQEKRLTAWFGIRGIGSLYYLMYAIEHGLPESQAQLLIGLTLATIVLSTLAHGISVTPLMKLYSRTAPEGK
jgi:NhaP-type Na+/H+ or K+/H+ antiporter